jgi:hypothetical protein
MIRRLVKRDGVALLRFCIGMGSSAECSALQRNWRSCKTGVFNPRRARRGINSSRQPVALRRTQDKRAAWRDGESCLGINWHVVVELWERVCASQGRTCTQSKTVARASTRWENRTLLRIRQKRPRKAERALAFFVSLSPPALKIERLRIDRSNFYANVVPGNPQERLGVGPSETLGARLKA